MNPIELIVGALAGQALATGISATRRYWSHRAAKMTEKTLTAMRDTQANSRWLVDYYENTHEGDSLFDCRILDFEKKIPFLTKPEWWPNNGNEIPEKGWGARFDIVEGDVYFPIDGEAINRRKQLGQRIWKDTPSVYLDRVDNLNGPTPVFVLKQCSYHQILSNIIRLEDETFRQVQVDRMTDADYRAIVLPNATTALRLCTKPFGLGGAVALVLKTKEDCRLLIHERSGMITTYPSARAVIPNFGFEPIPSHSDEIFRYNFLREYAEELFDFEELVVAAASRKINPLWFYELSSEVRHLRKALDTGLCTISFLGFGFDGLNGVPVVAYVAVIESPEVIADIEKGAVLNWEGKGIQQVSLKHGVKVLQDWLRDGEFHPGGAFTVARALQYLEKRRFWEPHS